MAEKRKLTIATDWDYDEFKAQQAKEKEQWPANELRLARLDVQHKIDHTSLTLEQVAIIGDLADMLIAQNEQQQSATEGIEE